jgi:hypothetical protein
MMVTFRRLSLVAPVLTAVVAAMVLIAIPAVPVRATDPPAEPPPPPAPTFTLVREPAFNPSTPLRGRVQLVDADGTVLHQWVSDQPNDMLGLSAVLVPDANGDGMADVAMSAPNAFDDVAGARVGTARIASGADGSTIARLSGTPIERFGVALFAPSPDGGAPQTLTVLVEHLDPSTGASYTPSAYTFRTFDALTGAILGEAVGAPAGFTASAARASLATHIRATGSADLDADGGVTTTDLSILAGNFGAAVDPVTGALLEADPTLAATPTGDTNGDGVVDSSDLLDVLTGFNPPDDPNFVPVEDALTEAEAAAIEGSFGETLPMALDCVWCALCWRGYCQVLPDRFGEADADGEPDFDPGTDGTSPPDGSTGGGGGPGLTGPNGDENGDGILNKNDCLSTHFTGDPMGCDANDNGVPDPHDCGSCEFVGDVTQCGCTDVDITFSPGCGERTPNYVWRIPESQLPKTVIIRACAGPPGGEYRWLPLHSEVAEYESGQDLTGSSVRVRLKKGGNFWATCEYTVTLDTQSCVHWEQFAGAIVHSVKLDSVEFAGGHTVLRDDGTAYPSPAWKDTNLDGDADDAQDHKFPIAFTRDTPWRVSEAIVRLEPPDVVVGPVTLTMTSPGKPTIESESLSIAAGMQFSSDHSLDSLPNTVDYHAALPITWKLDFGCDGKPNTKSFTTRHPYYVTLGHPTVQLHHTILHIGCKNAKSKSSVDDVVAGIWSEYTDRDVRRVDGVQLKYWNPPIDSDTDPVNGADPDYAEVLKRPAANGQCGSWAFQFRACLRVHGLTDGRVNRVLGPQGINGMMLVKNWQFPEAGSGSCEGYNFIYDSDISTPELEHADVIDLAGVPGQGNQNPPGAFVNHFVVIRKGTVYDPSYGVFATNTSAYENLTMAGWVRICLVENWGHVGYATPQDPTVDELTFNEVE